MKTRQRLAVVSEARAGVGREQLDRRALDAHRDEHRAAFLSYAAARSPFHRRRLSTNGRVKPFDEIPVLTRTDLMANLDEATTDRRLTRAAFDSHVASMTGEDPLLFGEFRVLMTGGTSGVTTYLAFDQASWRRVIAAFPQALISLGFGPRLFPRRRLALITAGGPLHMTFRAAVTNRSPVMASLRLDVTASVADITAALDRFQPDVLVGYPSLLAALADEQRAGRLAIHPGMVAAGSEQLRPSMRETVTHVWGAPFNVYATTEVGGVLAMECREHRGLHIREEFNDLEVVDAQDNPVPEGTTGAALLITSWLNPVVPIIRYRIDDQVAITSEPCACGRATRRIIDLVGRIEDTIRLDASAGGHIDVHPNHFEETIEGWPGVGQYQVVHRAGGITVSVVPAPGSPEGWDSRLADELHARLRSLGAEPPPIRIDLVSDLPRPATTGAKLQIVRNEV